MNKNLDSQGFGSGAGHGVRGGCAGGLVYIHPSEIEIASQVCQRVERSGALSLPAVCGSEVNQERKFTEYKTCAPSFFSFFLHLHACMQ